MDLELERYHKANAGLDLNISDLKLKQEGLKREVLAQRTALGKSSAAIKEFHHDLHEVAQSLQVLSLLHLAMVLQPG
jgi:cilia- and flagella-associated protein 57